MTLDETRQLGIEFERRIQTMIPETETVSKLDTETIYSYLNQYQDKLIQELYRTVDQVPVANNESYIERLLQALIRKVDLSISDTRPICRAELPEDFGLYIKSYTEVSDTYRFKSESTNKGIVPNEIISEKDVNKLIQSPQDSMRILRRPIVWLADQNGLGAIYDRYTEPIRITLEYYKRPQYMNLFTSTYCELPIEMFEQLVSGAVDLYVQYVAGAEARKRQMNEQAQRQNRRREEDERG